MWNANDFLKYFKSLFATFSTKEKLYYKLCRYLLTQKDVVTFNKSLILMKEGNEVELKKLAKQFNLKIDSTDETGIYILFFN